MWLILLFFVALIWIFSNKICCSYFYLTPALFKLQYVRVLPHFDWFANQFQSLNGCNCANRLLQLGMRQCWQQFRDMYHRWSVSRDPEIFFPFIYFCYLKCLNGPRSWLIRYFFLCLQIPSTYGPERLYLLRQLEKLKELETTEVNTHEDAKEISWIQVPRLPLTLIIFNWALWY